MKTFNNQLTKLLLVFLLTLGANFSVANSIENAQETTEETQLSSADIQLFNAVKKGELVPAIYAIEEGADVNARDRSGWTPLMFLARTGRTVLTDTLIDFGADVNATNRDGRTPLMIAAFYLNKEFIEHVIYRGGVNVNARDNNGDDALDLAIDKSSLYHKRQKDKEIIRILHISSIEEYDRWHVALYQESSP